MILNEELNKLLRNTIDLLLSSEGYTIRAKQDAPRPSGPHADVNVTLVLKDGTEEIKYENAPDDKVLRATEGLREAMVSINFYREGAFDNAQLIHNRLVRHSVVTAFRSAGVGLIGRSDVRDITEPLENGFEERAQMDIFLSFVGKDNELINTIGSVNIQSSVEIGTVIYNSIIED